MGGRLKGKVAIVTGAGRGIGRCHALALAAEGAAIVVNDLGVASDGSGTDQSPAQQVADEIKKAGGDAIASYGNVTKLEDCQKTVQVAVHPGTLNFEEVVHDQIGIPVLVNYKWR